MKTLLSMILYRSKYTQKKRDLQVPICKDFRNDRESRTKPGTMFLRLLFPT
jgi:hypothetical protein